MTNIKRIFQPLSHSTPVSYAILFVRLVIGAAFIQHGVVKIQNPFGWMGPGAAIPGFFQFLAAISEFGGGIALIVGLMVPLASFGISCTMVVATFMHAVVRGDPFVAKGGGPSYELALVFLSIAVLIITLGPGRFSIDAKLFGQRNS